MSQQVVLIGADTNYLQQVSRALVQAQAGLTPLIVDGILQAFSLELITAPAMVLAMDFPDSDAIKVYDRVHAKVPQLTEVPAVLVLSSNTPEQMLAHKKTAQRARLYLRAPLSAAALVRMLGPVLGLSPDRVPAVTARTREYLQIPAPPTAVSRPVVMPRISPLAALYSSRGNAAVATSARVNPEGRESRESGVMPAQQPRTEPANPTPAPFRAVEIGGESTLAIAELIARLRAAEGQVQALRAQLIASEAQWNAWATSAEETTQGLRAECETLTRTNEALEGSLVEAQTRIVLLENELENVRGTTFWPP